MNDSTTIKDVGDLHAAVGREQVGAALDASLSSVSKLSDLNIPKNAILLPSARTTISESAASAFSQIAPSLKMFNRGDRVVEVRPGSNGWVVDIIGVDAFRSKVEKHGQIVALRSGPHGETLMKVNGNVSGDVAKTWLESDERRLLPSLDTIVATPLLVHRADGSVATLRKGYDKESRVYVTGGQEVEQMRPADAVELLLDSLSEFDFASPADLSRAVAAMLTPAIKLGGFLPYHIPLFVFEANDSQSGKNYMAEMDHTIYGEPVSIAQKKDRGVGSFDETLSAALLNGKPFILLDNVRGKIGSEFFESLLTCQPGATVAARVPYKGEIQVDPSRFIFHLTGNGFESTKDLANRSCIIRIRKRKAYRFRDFPEGGLIEHIAAHQGRYLGAVHAIVSYWHEQGMKRTNDLRGQGRFRPWAQSLDWIVQKVCGLPPLLDGHEHAQERASSPAITWLRQLAIKIEEGGELGEPLRASRLAEISRDSDLKIPTATEAADEEQQAKIAGRILGPLFKGSDAIDCDGYTVTRIERIDSSTREVKLYVFERQ